MADLRRATPNITQPTFRQRLRLLQDGLDRCILKIRRIAVLAQDALDEYAHPRPCRFHSNIAPEAGKEFVGDHAQPVVTQDLDLRLVLGERVVEGDLVFREPCSSPRIRAARISLAIAISSWIT
jgi:hypothetical protein